MDVLDFIKQSVEKYGGDTSNPVPMGPKADTSKISNGRGHQSYAREDYLRGAGGIPAVSVPKPAVQPDVLGETLGNLGLLKTGYDAAETEYNAAQDAYTKAMQNAPADADFDTYLKPYRDRANAAEAALRSSRQNYEHAGGIGHSYSGEDRVSDIIKGGLGNSGAGAVNAAGSIYEGNVRGATADWERELQNLRDQRTEAIQTYRDTLQRYGGDENNRNVQAALRQVQRISEDMGMYNKALRGESDLLNTANRLYDTADNLSAASARDVARAKEGLGTVGQFAVDAGVAGVQMLGDAAIGAATGTGMLPVMGLRSYGSAAQEARQAGAGYEGQALYGIGSAAVEMLTEKIADGLAGLAGKGAADDVAEEVIRRLASSDTGRTVLRQLYGMSGEAFEEAISSLANPALRALYDKGAAAKESYGTAEGRKALLADTAYDSLVGAALGGAGSFGSVATGQNRAKNTDLRLADAGFGGVDSQVNDAWNVLNGRTTAEQQQARERAAQQRLGILDLIQPTQAAAETAPVQEAAETPAEAPQPVAPESVPVEAQAAESAPAPALNSEETTARTIEERVAENQRRMDEINRQLDNLPEDVTDEQVNALVNEGMRLDQERRALENEATQQARVQGGEVSRDFGNPGNHIDNRTNAGVANRNVKAFQFDHPELHEHFVNAAQALMVEVQAAETNTAARIGQKGSAVKRGPIRRLMDLGMTKPRIMQCLNDIIQNNGAENYADAKRVELVLNDMLTNGWTGYGNHFHDANADYIAAKEKITGAVKSDSWEKYLADREWMISTGDATEEQLRAEWEAQHPEAANPEPPSTPAPTEQPSQPTPPAPAAPAANNGGESGPGLPPTDTTTAESTNGRGRERERGVSKDVRSNPNTDEPLRDSFEQNREMYHQLTNAEVTERANAIIDKGFDAARSEVEQAIGRAKAGMKLPPEIAVAGYQIANEMSRRGDLESARNLCADIAAELTAGGQLGQIGKLVLNFAPAVRGMTVQKIVDNLNGGLSGSQKASNKAKRGDAPSSIEVTAATEAAKDSAIKKTAERFLERAESDNAEWEPFDFAGSAAKEVANSIKREIKNSFSPAKEKNAMDTFVRYVKKFAQEKISIEKKKSSPMTATKLLSEVVQNEDLFREVYERAQAEFSKEDSTGYREFVNDYLNTPVGLDGSDARNKIFMRAIAESAANTQENAKYIREQSALGVPTNEIANAIASDLISATKASGDIAASIRESAVTYVNSIINSDENSETRAGKIVADMMRNIAQKFRDVAVQGDATKQSIENDIADMLAIDYALSPESAKKISESVSNEYERQLSEAIQKELERRFANKPRAQKQQKSLATVLTEAINLGAFNSEYANEAIRKVFGVEGEITIDQSLLKEYVNAEDEAAAAAILDKIEQNIADQIPATFRDKFTALRYMNMLGNLKTQGRNILGNTLMLVATNVKYTTQSVAELAAAAASGGKYQRNTSLFTNADLRRQAAADFDANVDEIKGESRYADVAKQSIRSIADKQRIFDSKILEGARKATNWAMDQGDVIFMRAVYTRAFAGWMQAHGVTDVANATADQLSSARAFAAKEAQEATFHDSNVVSDWVSRIGRGQNTPAAVRAVSEGVMPFRKTPANVAVRAVEYSPVGIAETVYKGVQAAKGNATAADVINSAAKNVTGTALAIAGFFLAAAGKARGSGNDEDKELNDFQKMQGAMDYSVKIGDTHISLSQFAPSAIPFFMGVKLQELLANNEDLSLDDIGDMLGVISDPMLEMSMLQGVNDLLGDIASLNGDTDAIPSLVANAALSYLSQGLTNTLLGQAEQASEANRQTTYSDTKSKDANAIDQLLGAKGQYQIGKMFAKMPGWDYNQQDYVDAWGRTQSNGESGKRVINAFINPTYLSGDRSTKVDTELERLHNENADVEGFPNVFPQKRSRSATIGDGIVMTPDEYLQYSKAAGQKKLELVSDFMDSAEYKTLTDTQRAEVIQNLYSFADDLALQGIKRDNGITKQSDYQKLLEGKNEPGTSYDVPALKEKNAGEYIAFNSAYSSAQKDSDYSVIDDLLKQYSKLNSNTQAVLTAKNPKDLKNLLAFGNAGSGSESYYKIKSAIGDAQWDLDANSAQGSHVRMAGLADADVSTAEKDKLVESGAFNLSGTAKSTYGILRDFGMQPKDISQWFENADWYASGTGKDPKADGSLNAYEVATAISKIPNLSDQQRNAMYQQFKQAIQRPNDAYDTWKEKSYTQALRQSTSYGRVTGKGAEIPSTAEAPAAAGQTQNVIDYLLNLGRNGRN